MYVPFGKSVGDVTFRSSLRPHFWPRLKKTMEHNPWLHTVRNFVKAPTCFDRLRWNFADDFILMYYRSSLSVINFRQSL